MNIVRHVKRGREYLLLGEFELQSSGGPVAEGASIAAYVGTDDGKAWARPAAEFNDGRFEHVRELSATDIELLAQMLVDAAQQAGVVLTVEQVPLQPLAMRHYRTVVSVRSAR